MTSKQRELIEIRKTVLEILAGKVDSTMVMILQSIANRRRELRAQGVTA